MQSSNATRCGRSSLVAGTCALAIVLSGCTDGEQVGSTEQAAKVCAGSATLKGIDVAHYDGDIDWAKVAADGNAFGFAKATEGTTFVDPKFAQNWADMKANGVARGAYHFFHSNDDPIAQADFFLSTVGPLDPDDLPVTLDLEVADGQTPATIEAGAIAWLDHVAQVTGKKPIVYTSKRVMTEYVGNAMGLDQHAVLWDAQWNVTCPDLPDTFSTWAFWQSTDMGTVSGVPTPSSVDLDTFNGDLAALHALGVASSSASGGGAAATSSGTGSVGTSQSAGAGGAKSATSGAGGGAQAAGGAGAMNGGSGCSIASADEDRGHAWLGVALALGLALGQQRRRRR